MFNKHQHFRRLAVGTPKQPAGHFVACFPTTWSLTLFEVGSSKPHFFRHILVKHDSNLGGGVPTQRNCLKWRFYWGEILQLGSKLLPPKNRLQYIAVLHKNRRWGLTRFPHIIWFIHNLGLSRMAGNLLGYLIIWLRIRRDTVYPQMPHFQLAIFVYRSQLFVYRSSRLVISQTEKMIHQVKFSRHTPPI